jgi:hypothetical protein
MPRDPDWIDNLLPYEAQAALDALNAQKVPLTVNEGFELVKLRRALQAKANPS